MRWQQQHGKYCKNIITYIKWRRKWRKFIKMALLREIKSQRKWLGMSRRVNACMSASTICIHAGRQSVYGRGRRVNFLSYCGKKWKQVSSSYNKCILNLKILLEIDGQQILINSAVSVVHELSSKLLTLYKF